MLIDNVINQDFFKLVVLHRYNKLFFSYNSVYNKGFFVFNRLLSFENSTLLRVFIFKSANYRRNVINLNTDHNFRFVTSRRLPSSVLEDYTNKIVGLSDAYSNWLSSDSYNKSNMRVLKNAYSSKEEDSIYKYALDNFTRKIKTYLKEDYLKGLYTKSLITNYTVDRYQSKLISSYYSYDYKWDSLLADNSQLAYYNGSDLVNLLNKLKVFYSRSRSFSNTIKRMTNVKKAHYRKKSYKGLKYSRVVFRKLMSIRLKGTNRLIRSVKTFNNKDLYQKSLMLELNILSVLVSVGFASSLNDAKFLIKNSLVYVNGYLETNCSKVLRPGDRVQLPVSKESYQWYKNREAFIEVLKRKINRVSWLKSKNKLNRFKKRSYRYPRWLFKYALLSDNTPSIYEVDKTLLTAVLLTNPKSYTEFGLAAWRFLNLGSHNIYLWKLVN